MEFGTKRVEDFMTVEKIGEGSYGEVYKGRNKITGQYVAMKKIRIQAQDEGIPATSIREISLLKELDHPNIVKLEDVLMEDSRLYLIFEFLSMDLRMYLNSLEKDKYMEPYQVKSYLYQINSAILFCHRRRILHRDLKPQNLLVDKKGLIKVADFGVSRAIGVPVIVYSNEVVTLPYRAPEVLLGTKIILKTPTEDIWPGVSELLKSKTFFTTWTSNNLHKHTKNIDKDGMDLLEKMLIYDPEKRISAQQARLHSYFNDVRLPAGLLTEKEAI